MPPMLVTLRAAAGRADDVAESAQPVAAECCQCDSFADVAAWRQASGSHCFSQSFTVWRRYVQCSWWLCSVDSADCSGCCPGPCALSACRKSVARTRQRLSLCRCCFRQCAVEQCADCERSWRPGCAHACCSTGQNCAWHPASLAAQSGPEGMVLQHLWKEQLAKCATLPKLQHCRAGLLHSLPRHEPCHKSVWVSWREANHQRWWQHQSGQQNQSSPGQHGQSDAHGDSCGPKPADAGDADHDPTAAGSDQRPAHLPAQPPLPPPRDAIDVDANDSASEDEDDAHLAGSVRDQPRQSDMALCATRSKRRPEPSQARSRRSATPCLTFLGALLASLCENEPAGGRDAAVAAAVYGQVFTLSAAEASLLGRSSQLSFSGSQAPPRRALRQPSEAGNQPYCFFDKSLWQSACATANFSVSPPVPFYMSLQPLRRFAVAQMLAKLGLLCRCRIQCACASVMIRAQEDPLFLLHTLLCCSVGIPWTRQRLSSEPAQPCDDCLHLPQECCCLQIVSWKSHLHACRVGEADDPGPYRIRCKSAPMRSSTSTSLASTAISLASTSRDTTTTDADTPSFSASPEACAFQPSFAAPPSPPPVPALEPSIDASPPGPAVCSWRCNAQWGYCLFLTYDQ